MCGPTAAGRERGARVAATSRCYAKLTGANPVDVRIEFPLGQSLYSPETLKTIADVLAIVED
ncbi:MAG: hypothetical protein ACK5E1_06470, partial [Bradyrhizobium sp.]|uniref:hypothetical protein n=1 Tax=Bradyrhizobium sp. TaxID=376 RepID=UPI003918C58F